MPRVAIMAAVTLALALPRVAGAQRWQDATANCTGTTAEWSNKVELADIDGDGKVDILIANGGDYSSAGTPEPVRVWKNLGTWATAPACTEISAQAVLGFTGLSRAIKVADVDGDGDLDIITGGAWQTQLRLYLREPTGWVDATDHLPQQLTSAGDFELGDVDGDGDLDLVIADWGPLAPGAPLYAGGRTRLYLNDGTGRFTDVTSARMPDLLVAWSWDLELVDIDQDWDLDILVSCKLCARNFVFRNDGTGTFTDDPAALPAFTNNYEFEAMDIDGDGDLDLMTINDGGQNRDRLLVNDGTGRFSDETAARLAGTANPPVDDNAAVFLDVDSDGDADLFVASLSGPDRLLLNNGAGVFTLSPDATPDDTPGSLGVAVADLDGDGRLDVVQAQGEAAFPEKVQLASSEVAVDTAPPVIARYAFLNGQLVARIHDHQSPSRAHDWQRVWIEHDGGATELQWYGEYLWRAAVAQPAGAFRLCAKDRAGNQACVEAAAADGAVAEAGIDPGADAGPGGGGGGGGCCETGGGSPGGALALASPLAALLRRRRRQRVSPIRVTPSGDRLAGEDAGCACTNHGSRGRSAQCQKPIETARLR
ncbi:MAG TPA: VCBS repeat-containing protein [Kofleriaceae bacterium]|nr:VCBS repeat-containing protein [Kofleriaceae bacterium]